MKCFLREKYKQIAFVSLSVFIIFVLALKFGIFDNMNQIFYNFTKEYKNNNIYNVAIVFSDLFGSLGSLLLFSAFILILLKLHKMQELYFALIFAALSVGATLLLKYTLQIQRPLNFINGLTGYSFPSGHGVLSIVLAVVLFLLVSSLVKNNFILQAVKFILLLYIFVSMFARIYVGSHWVSDVLGSILLVVFSYSVSCLLFDMLKSRVKL